MRRVPILLFALLVVTSCDRDLSLQSTAPPEPPTVDDLIIADCYVLRDALEAFAAENDGVYPSQIDEQSDAGKRFRTFLPGGAPFTNHYSAFPIDNLFGQPQWPGEIGVLTFWVPLAQYDLDPPRGYRITGRGRDGVLITIANLDDVPSGVVAKYDSVLANLETVVQAVELFAQIGGEYPADVGADALPNGDTLIDLLPGGRLLVNPFNYYVQDSPVDGDPTGTWGGIGYTPWDTNGDGTWDGYQIDAMGANPNIRIATRLRDVAEDGRVRNIAFLLRETVEIFATLDGGEYPRNLGVDETPAGETVLEILSCTCTNPYTNTPAVKDGLAYSRGEVGYQPLEYNGVVVGYVINAMGLFEEIERFEELGN